MGRRAVYFCIMSWTNSLSAKPSVSGSTQKATGKPTVDTPVTVLVGLADHLVHLVVRQLLANRGHDVAQLGRRDEAVIVTIKDLVAEVRDSLKSMTRANTP